MIFGEKERIVFIGDSVTDFGRVNPVGEGFAANWGTGYVATLGNFFNAFYPEMNLRITNVGTSGNTIRDLKERWQADVIDLKPDWVSICIGINDVWRQFDCPDVEELGVGLEEYEETYRKLLDKTIKKVKGIILMTPYYMEPLKEDMMRKRMDEYTNVVKKLGCEYGLRVVDLQAMFDKYLLVRHSSYINWDRVHPNPVGALLVANEFLKTVEFDRNLLV